MKGFRMIRASFIYLSDGRMAIRRPAPAAEGQAETTGDVTWEIVEVDQEAIEQVRAAFHRRDQMRRLREQLETQVDEGTTK